MLDRPLRGYQSSWLAAVQNKEQSGTGGKEAGTSAPKDAPALPNAAVKRIIMLDADQTRLSAGAVSVCAKAAELFLEALAGKAHAEATGAARGTIAFRDVGALCHFGRLCSPTPRRPCVAAH